MSLRSRVLNIERRQGGHSRRAEEMTDAELIAIACGDPQHDPTDDELRTIAERQPTKGQK